ncbi:MAG: NADPH-dependent F420 reductase [Gemmatimonadaceae bacterium]
MRIGILGSGLMGAKLGTIFARAGHDVVFSYSHSEAKLKRLVRDAGARASWGTPADAARNADALLLAVHWSRVDDVLKKAGNLSGKIIVSCSLPMNADDTALVVAHKSSGAEKLARKRPKARVVSAFNTVPSEVLFAVFERAGRGMGDGGWGTGDGGRGRREAGGGDRPSLVYCGDNAAAKKVAAQLINDVGFEPVDAGPLRIARYTEPYALLVAQLAYEGERGPAMAYRFEWMAERSKP